MMMGGGISSAAVAYWHELIEKACAAYAHTCQRTINKQVHFGRHGLVANYEYMCVFLCACVRMCECECVENEINYIKRQSALQPLAICIRAIFIQIRINEYRRVYDRERCPAVNERKS